MKMNINALISIFTPKDGKFFPLLNEMATILDSSATLLHELFTASEDDRKAQLCKLIKDEELKGDKWMKKIFKELNNTFITPFDREDISSLADELDDAIDAINRSAQKVVLYSPEELPASTKQMTDIIKSEAEEVRTAVGALDKLRKSDTSVVRGCAKKIKKLEEEADAVYERGITELFHGNIKTLELIKLKEIIQELEHSANSINTVGKAIKTIIVKYA
jgi:predicted phosphate transport protein (TIGR00153 family)